MSAKVLAASTVNTVAGFSIGAVLVMRGFVGIGSLVIVLGFLAGIVIVGNGIEK